MSDQNEQITFSSTNGRAVPIASLRVTVDYLLDGIVRAEQTRDRRAFTLELYRRPIVLIVMATLLAWSVETVPGHPIFFLVSFGLATYALALAIGAYYRYVTIRSGMAKSANLDMQLEMSFMAEGIRLRLAGNKTSVRPWQDFYKVAHFDEGYLILEYSNDFHWIPFESFLDAAEREAVGNLLKKKIPIHTFVPGVCMAMEPRDLPASRQADLKTTDDEARFRLPAPKAWLVVTPEYLLQQNERLERFWSRDRWFSPFWVLCAAPLFYAGLWALPILANERPFEDDDRIGIAMFMIGALVMVATTLSFPRIKNRYLRRRFRRMGRDRLLVRAEFRLKGIYYRSQIDESFFAWRNFWQVAYFRDGFLLLRGAESRWFPKSAFETEEQWYDSRALLNDKLAYVIVEALD